MQGPSTTPAPWCAWLDVSGFATSKVIWAEAEQLGIPMMTEDMPEAINVTIDGGDEVDPALNLIKLVAARCFEKKSWPRRARGSSRVVIVVDETKLSARLGMRRVIPVEVVAFGCRSQWRFLESLCAEVMVRGADGAQFVTDSGNMILDCNFGPTKDPAALARELGARAGIA